MKTVLSLKEAPGMLVNKDNWPRNEFGTIDWERVFENPPEGLICMLSNAESEDKILRCSRVIVDALFSRQSDLPLRDEFLTSLDYISGGDGRGESRGDDIRELSVRLLREVKEKRIELSNAHIEKERKRKTADLHDEEGLRRDGEEVSAATEVSVPKEAEEPNKDHSPFCIALASVVGERLKPLRCNGIEQLVENGPMSFVVSEAFSNHLSDVIMEQIAPVMSDNVRSLSIKAEDVPEEEQVGFIINEFEDRKQRESLWDHWRSCWEQCTRESEIPKKPKEKKKGLGGILKRKTQTRYNGNELTIDEWTDACKAIKNANVNAMAVWGRICQKSDTYQAPLDEDNTLLMNLFARTPLAIEKQIRAIHQIATQDGNQPAAFAKYQQGKDVDIALLAACYQNPKLLVTNGFLKDCMRSFPESMRRDNFPLTERYLTSYM